MILWGNLPPDIRVRREAKYLARKGHNVDVICENDGTQPEKEILDCVTITRIPARNHNPVRQAIFHLTLIDPLWYHTIRKVTRDSSFDIVHVHDLPPVKTTYLANRSTRAKVIADLHELYPESLAKHREKMSRGQRLLRPIWRYKRVEEHYLERVDGLFVESTEAERHYATAYGLDPETIEVLRNVPDVDRLSQINVRPKDHGDEFLVIYIGNFTAQRDLDTLIRGFHEFHSEYPSSRLLMIGDGQKRQSLEELTHDLGNEDAVEFTGWIDFESIFDHLTVSDVGICTWVGGNEDSKCTLPNKLFQYMYAGVPVVASDLPAMKEIVEKTECGLIVPPGDPTKLATMLENLFREPGKRECLGKKGRRAVENKYNFEQEGERLIGAYRKVLR